jgi:hypothetical protein
MQLSSAGCSASTTRSTTTCRDPGDQPHGERRSPSGICLTHAAGWDTFGTPTASRRHRSVSTFGVFQPRAQRTCTAGPWCRSGPPRRQSVPVQQHRAGPRRLRGRTGSKPDGVRLWRVVRRHIFTPLGHVLHVASRDAGPVGGAEGHVVPAVDRYATLAGTSSRCRRSHRRLPGRTRAQHPVGPRAVRARHARRGPAARLPAPILRADTAAPCSPRRRTFGPNPFASIGLVWSVFDYGTRGVTSATAASTSGAGATSPAAGPSTGEHRGLRQPVAPGRSRHLAPAQPPGRPAIGDVVTAWVNGTDPAAALGRGGAELPRRDVSSRTGSAPASAPGRRSAEEDAAAIAEARDPHRVTHGIRTRSVWPCARWTPRGTMRT